MCSVEGCDRQRQRRGWCMRHYQRWWRTGQAEARLPEGCGCRMDRLCDAHRPPVCVCDAPTVGPTAGECAACRRLCATRSPAHADRLAEVRRAWRRWLADERVLHLLHESEKQNTPSADPGKERGRGAEKTGV